MTQPLSFNIFVCYALRHTPRYTRLFCTSRIPVPRGVDAHLTDSSSRHIVVLRGAGMYRIDVVDDEGRIASEGMIEAALCQVIDCLEPDGADGSADGDNGDSRDELPHDDQIPMATFTTVGREEWGDVREQLLQTAPCNGGSLHTIETAILHVCLDKARPAGPSERFAAYVCGW